MIQKYKIHIEYVGKNYFGWQKQPNKKTIQETIEKAIYSYCQEKVKVFGCSRTDAKVNALDQVAHFTLENYRNQKSIMYGLNFHMKEEMICIKKVKEVNIDFNARKDAKGKCYLYKIINRNSRPIIEHQRSWHIKKKINKKTLLNTVSKLIGKHDFSSFRGRHCQSTRTIRSISNIEVSFQEEHCNIRFFARSFLQHQIRIMTAVIIDISTGKNINIEEMLNQKNRSFYNQIAPAYGLYLEKIFYDNNDSMF